MLAEVNARFRYDNGKLFHISGHKKGQKAGRTANSSEYDSISINNKRYYVHRLVWLIHNGKFPGHQIDHINGNKWDNRIENLREVLPHVNNQNIKNPRSSSKLQMLGVSYHQTGYRASIMKHGKLHYLGMYKTKQSAHNAYLFAKQIIHKESNYV